MRPYFSFLQPPSCSHITDHYRPSALASFDPHDDLILLLGDSTRIDRIQAHGQQLMECVQNVAMTDSTIVQSTLSAQGCPVERPSVFRTEVLVSHTIWPRRLATRHPRSAGPQALDRPKSIKRGLPYLGQVRFPGIDYVCSDFAW